MDRRPLLVGAMWTAALVVVAAITLSDRDAFQPRPAGPPGDAPLSEASSGPVGGASRRDLPVPEIAPGPPRQYRGDARHTGRSPYAGPRQGRVRWSFEARGPVFAQAAVGADGRVVFGDLAGWLYVVAPDGTLLWERDLRGPVYGTPFIDDDGAIFVGCDADTLFAFEADGRRRFALATEGDADTGVVPAPDGSLRFAAGPDLWSISRDGTLRWRFRARGKIFTTPALDSDGTAYVGDQSDRLHAVGPDGRLRWSFTAGDDIDSSPVLGDDGTIYFGSDDGRVYAVDRDGGLVFAHEVGGHVRAPVGLGTAGDVLVSVYGPRARVVALDRETGEERWAFSIGIADGDEVGTHSGPTVDRDGVIYVGGHDDFAYALGTGGALRFSVATLGDVEASPVIAPDGTLYVGSRDQRLYAIE